jgi:hypothetical protein
MLRTTVSLSAICAVAAMCSLNRTPGTLVSTVFSMPRYSGGASGFGSKLSMWAKPPFR